MRRAFPCLGFLVAGAASGLAAPWTEEPVTTVETTWVSERVERGVERAGPAVQARVAWTGGPWRAAAGLSRALTAEGLDEAGIRLARIHEVGRVVEVEASLAWASAGGLPGTSPRDAWEAGLRVARRLPHDARISGAWWHDFSRRANTAEVALEHSWPLTRLGTYLDTRLWLGWIHAEDWRPEVAGPAVAGGYGYGGGAVELPYRVGAHTTLLAGLEFSTSWNARDAGWRAGLYGPRNLIGRIGVSFDF